MARSVNRLAKQRRQVPAATSCAPSTTLTCIAVFETTSAAPHDDAIVVVIANPAGTMWTDSAFRSGGEVHGVCMRGGAPICGCPVGGVVGTHGCRGRGNR